MVMQQNIECSTADKKGMDRLLQVGDIFLLQNGMTVYYQDMESTLGLKQEYTTFIKQTVEVDGESYGKNKEVVLERPTPPEGEYIVLSTELAGGGYGHGIHDYFPDGHKIIAKNISSNEEISFYQSVGFTASIMPEEITFVRSEEEDPWIKTSDKLPEDRQKVLIYYGEISVAEFVKGISEEERKLMGKSERSKIYCFGDESGNNKVPYRWDGDGPMDWFGQEVTHWQPLPKPPKAVL